MLQLRYRRVWIGMVCLLVAAIIVASLVPDPMLGGAGPYSMGHFTAYFLLALLGAGLTPLEAVWRVMARAFLLGIALEAAQGLLTETRHAEWGDVGADAAGVLVAWFLVQAGLAGWAQRVEAWLANRQRH